MIRIKAALASRSQPRVMEDPQELHVTPIEGARPETPHPVRAIWRGVGEVTLFFGEGLLAVLDFLFGRPPRPRRPKTPHPVKKAAPFPIND